MAYSLDDVYKQGFSAWNKPFELEGDSSKVYRLTKSGLQCWDVGSNDWVAATEAIDPNAVQFVDSAKGLIRRYEVQEGYIMADGTFKQVRFNKDLSRDEQM